eukprot:CAMPEP_0113568908 /NCGR_PEP_ID=MMETSP0015_2-20120614/24110_1 /TAXON_ID=2838 /ORGANISM="Odontella" /LENGTH=173 /DNA_ID=CAMNT_0000471501 /DNA_START=1419 /DNA_END=1938 /DNA_ORIENTATION=+ /assembly_acc=CAM_ASM_000160
MKKGAALSVRPSRRALSRSRGHACNGVLYGYCINGCTRKSGAMVRRATVACLSRSVASPIRASPGCAASTAASTAATVGFTTSENPNQSPSPWHDGGSLFWFTSLTNATSVGSKTLGSIVAAPRELGGAVLAAPGKLPSLGALPSPCWRWPAASPSSLADGRRGAARRGPDRL